MREVWPKIHRELLWQLCEVLGMSVLAGAFIVMVITFSVAYFHPTRQTLVDINSMGEANAEFVFLILCLVIICLTFFRRFKAWGKS